MFKYFPTNYVWNLSVDLSIEMGARIGEIEEMCAPLEDAAKAPDAAGTKAFRESWENMADKLVELAAEDEARGRLISSGDKLLRAANYMLTAERLQAHGSEGRMELYRRFLTIFQKGLAQTGAPARRVEIPYEGTHLSALYVPARNVSGAQPLLVQVNGLDSTKEMKYLVGLPEWLAQRGARYLQRHPGALGRPLSKLILADLARDDHADADGDLVEWRCGDLADPTYLDFLLADPADCFFHLASVPVSLAERQPELGLSINLLAPIGLAQRLAWQGREGRGVPRVVFASTIAVYGRLGSEPVAEDCEPCPAMSYGAHKLMTEVLLADLSRRGEIDARSLRLPGIVARPAAESGHGSAFMSMLFHKARSGDPYICPVSRHARAWWMSLKTCVANLVHAGSLDPAGPTFRTWQLPALHASVDEIVAALTRRFGQASTDRFRFEPDAAIETLFGRFPPLETPRAKLANFVMDRDPDTLVANVFDR